MPCFVCPCGRRKNDRSNSLRVYPTKLSLHTLLCYWIHGPSRVLLRCFSHLLKTHSGIPFDFNESLCLTGEPSFQFTIYMSDTRLFYSEASRPQEQFNEALQCLDEIHSIRRDSPSTRQRSCFSVLKMI